MRYFQIYADIANPQPQVSGWYQVVPPGPRPGPVIYQSLKQRNLFPAELNEEVEFLDIISHPYFMVSKEFAALIHLYDSGIPFKTVQLFDKKNKRSGFYRIPNLPEIYCLSPESELSRDKNEIKNGILRKEAVEEFSIFKIKDVGNRYIIANLELVESAYRRKVKGMAIKEFVIQ